MRSARFSSGTVLITRDVDAAFGGRLAVVADLLARHLAGDWDHLDPRDQQANEAALQNGECLLTVFGVENRLEVWMLTDGPRRTTVVALSDRCSGASAHERR